MSVRQEVRSVLACCLMLLISTAVAVPSVQLSGRTYTADGDTLWMDSDGCRWEVIGDVVTIAPAEGYCAQELADSLSSHGLEIGFFGPSGSYCDVAVPEGSGPLDVLGTCLQHLDIDDAWANTRVRLAAAPSDSFFAEHIGWWRQWNLARIRAEDAWTLETGDTTVVIAVLDTGIEVGHDDLFGNLWVNWAEYSGTPSSDDDNNGYVDDIYGANVDNTSGDVDDVYYHGTVVSGIVAAQTNNDGTGVAGLAGGWYDEAWSVGDRGSGCRIMTAASPTGNKANLRKGLLYAASMGAHVANMSFSTPKTQDWVEAVETAADSGMVLVAAMDNQATAKCPFPAGHEDVIAVGATDYLDRDAFWQNYSDSLEVVAPSGACPTRSGHCHSDCTDRFPEYLCQMPMWCVCDSLFLWSTGDPLSADGYGFFSGTSASTPQIAALAGLLLSADASLNRDEVRALVQASAQDKIGDSEDTRGRDEHYGFGLVDAYAALFLARGGGATTSNLRLCYDVEFDRDVKISSGDTLTLLPGVEVSFASGSDAANLGIDSSRCELIVEGTLIAEGTHADTLVTFTTEVDSAGAWYGIRALADTGTIHMEYCAVENAYKGIAVEAPDSLYVSEVTIEDCVTHGISCKECDSSMTVESCTIDDPGLIGIDASDCDGLLLSDHDITDATAYGIRCLDAEGMTVEDNTILGASGESGFVGIHYVCASGDTTLTIEDNTISRCGARGIYCEGGGDGTSSITGNLISDDGYDRGTVGIYLKTCRAAVHYNETEKKGTGVSVLPGMGTPKWIPDLGNGTSQQQGNNSWLDNTTWYVWTLLASPDTLYAESNWHGMKNPSSSMFSSTVDYLPVLESAPSARINPGADDDESHKYSLSQNRPNPFNPTTTIEYSIWVPGRVTLRVYNMAGKLVRTLVNAVQEPGHHDVIWDGSDDQGRQVAGGVYFARMVSGGETKMRKLILLK